MTPNTHVDLRGQSANTVEEAAELFQVYRDSKIETLWECLSPADNAGIRHCQECTRAVHLALTVEDFRRYAERGYCVAVRVI